jgi:hypothetical protein
MLSFLPSVRKHLLLIFAFTIVTSQIVFAQAPQISTDASSQSACLYDSARFLITISNYDNTTTNRWQYSTDNITWFDITNDGNQHSSNTPYFEYTSGAYILLVGTNLTFINTTYYYHCVFTNSQGTTTSSPVTLTVNSSLPTNTSASTITICNNNNFPGTTYPNQYSDHSTCSPIDSITSSPGNQFYIYPEITTCVSIDPSVQTYNGVPYVQRRYNIDVPSFASGYSATITLYYLQQDFDNYNAARGTLPALPTGPTDAVGISNLRVTQYHGTGTTPGTYVGTAGEINPDDNNIIWNATLNRWEVTFNIVGFSGFFISTGSLLPLPLTLLSFEGNATSSSNNLKWTTTSEINVSHFEIERSEDGINFSSIGKVAAFNQSTLVNTYNYNDIFQGGSKQFYYYRLNMIDIDGKHSYSKIISFQPFNTNFSVQALPNPFSSQITISANLAKDDQAIITLTDASGKKILSKTIALKKGVNTFQLSNMSSLQSGFYILNFSTSDNTRAIKLIKQD